MGQNHIAGYFLLVLSLGQKGLVEMYPGKFEPECWIISRHFAECHNFHSVV